MRILSFLAILSVGLGACTNSSTSTPPSSPPPILTVVAGVVCPVETAIMNDFGAAVVAQCAGTATGTACGAAFQQALGAANLCGVSGISAVTTAQIEAQKAQVKAGKLIPRGIVGNVACPLAIGSVFGLLSTQIPAACGCTQNLSQSTVDATLTAACEIIVPI